MNKMEKILDATTGVELYNTVQELVEICHRAQVVVTATTLALLVELHEIAVAEQDAREEDA